MSIAILGAGAFGTALAISLAQDGRDVRLWGRDVKDMQIARQNLRHLPGFYFPPSLVIEDKLDHALRHKVVLLAVPMQKLRNFLIENNNLISDHVLVGCCKGIDLTTGHGPVQLIRQLCPAASPAILSGPSFAVDIAGGLPTALTIAAQDAAVLQDKLSTQNIRLYRSEDLTGVEIGGALKNVVAIACGIAIGAGFGESARAALMTRGFAEMQRFALASGAHASTLAGLSGFGDLTLSCSSEKSRNFAFGLRLGRGDKDEVTQTIEGRATAKAVTALAETMGIDMPIASMVVNVAEQKISIKHAVDMFFSRPLKEE